MRIALVSREYPPLLGGGIGTYLSNFSAAASRAGHEVHVFTVQTGPADEGVRVEDVRIHRVPQPQGPSPVAEEWRDLRRITDSWLLQAAYFEAAVLAEHERAPFDVIEFPEYEAPGLPLLFREPAGFLSVVHFHTPTCLVREIDGHPPLPGAELEILQAALADGLTSPSRALADRIEEEFDLPQPIEVIPYPFPADSFAPRFVPPAGKNVLYVGRLERRKGVEVLVRAAMEVLRRVPDARFTLVGGDTASGPGGQSMREHLRSLVPPEAVGRIRFLDARPHEQLPGLFAEAAICVFPSLFENYPNVCLEAMAVGRAAIVTRGTGMPEMLGEAGATCTPGDPAQLARLLIEFLESPDTLVEMGRTAFRRVREIAAPGAIVRRRVAFYERLREEAPLALRERLARAPHRVLAASLPFLSDTALAGHRAAARGAHHVVAGLGRLLDVLDRGRARGWRRVLLFGAGKHTERLLARLRTIEGGLSLLVGVIDESPERIGDEIHGLPILSPDAAVGLAPDAVVISSDALEAHLLQRAAPLVRAGIPVETLYGAK